MRRFLFALFILSYLPAVAQVSSVINRYAAVTGQVNDCTNSFRVDTATGFSAGDTVLVIQMQGASIDSSDSETFGQILAMNGAGNYEYNIVQSVTGNVIRLRNQLLKAYDIPNGRVQFVRVPSYTTYTVALPQTCMPWNGAKGGVYAIKVSGTLTLNSPISVSGAGFRGGQPLLISVASCNKTGYYYPPTNNEGGQKGEGVAVLSTSRRYGRGRLANGGGGGNDHNAGGGGGGTYGDGGTGGKQFNIGSCATNPDIGGIGGAVGSDVRTDRLLMGGGGGSGHGNERGEKGGGNGGGIMIIDAGSISNSSAQQLSANGDDAPQCTAPGNPGGDCMNDGGGGGGGGGCIYITAGSVSGSIPVNAKGGKGSNVYVGNGVTASGPGGGGGGGSIAVTPAAASRTTQSISGGASGTLPQLNTAYGAMQGTNGQSLNSAAIPFSTKAFTTTAIKPTYRDSLAGCLVRQLFNTTATPVPGPTQANWTVTGVGSSASQNPVFTFPSYGNYEVILSVTDANGCRDSIHSTLNVSPPAGISMDSTFCGGSALVLNARPGVGYVWSPAFDLSSPTTRRVQINNIGRNDSTKRMFRVVVTISPGCSVTDTFNVTVNAAPFAEFSFRPDPPQTNKPVVFTSKSRNDTALLWSFGDGSSAAEPSPSHLYMETNTFEVCLIAISNQGCPDTSCTKLAADYKQTVAVASGFSPNGDGNNDVLHVKGGPFASLKFVIFNRWGQMVYESTDPNAGWDGTFRGAPQPVDVYVYVVNISYMNGTTQTIKGNVTLLR
jgi:gliding motility-associated-like protein